MESFLTPRTQKWHSLMTGDSLLDQNQEVAKYLERVCDVLFRARYAPEANFANQIMEGYLSLGVHGTAVLFIDDDLGRGLRYQCIPVHEVYLAANAAGKIDTVFRLYRLTARQALAEFGQALPPDIWRDAQDERRMETEHEFIHGVYPREDLRPGRRDAGNRRLASVHVARNARCLVRESGYRVMPYAVSRFSVAPGEVYGRSPAMEVMPDIVQANAMKKTLIRAGEKMVNPPLLLPDDDILSAFSLKAGSLNHGGVDEQGRQLVVPLQLGGNLPFGQDFLEQARLVINEAFYINLFQILVESPQKTATEVVERAQEKAQLLAPAMGRQQSELLRPIIERELDIIIAAGALDPGVMEVPEILADRGGPRVMPRYETPMARALDSGDSVAILQALQGLSGLAQFDPAVTQLLKASAAGRDICRSLGVPARDLRTDEELAALEAERKEAEQAALTMQGAQTAIGGLEGLAGAEKDFQQSLALAEGSAAASGQ